MLSFHDHLYKAGSCVWPLLSFFIIESATLFGLTHDGIAIAENIR